MEDTEDWKDINNFDNYKISTFGNIRNKKTGRILKPANNGGYLYVGLSNIKTKTFPLHRLVAKTFLENPENKGHVNHKDKNGLNNNLANLEWNTPKENNMHKSLGVIQTTNQNLGIWRVDLKSGDKIEKYNSINLASKWIFEQNLSENIHSIKSSISCAIRGVYKTSFGFKWELDKDEDLENEIWKEINIENKDTSGYFVSSLGRFKNKKGIIMKDYKPHHSGYVYIRVNIKKYALHRIVALTFIENSENKPFVNHIDGNKLNNKLDNLEWVTCSENNLHAHKIGLTKGSKREIIQYDLEMNEIQKFNKIKDASVKLNICYSSIKAVLYKKQKTAGGFIFKYLEE
jgi:hypothetical protein